MVDKFVTAVFTVAAAWRVQKIGTCLFVYDLEKCCTQSQCRNRRVGGPVWLNFSISCPNLKLLRLPPSAPDDEMSPRAFSRSLGKQKGSFSKTPHSHCHFVASLSKQYLGCLYRLSLAVISCYCFPINQRCCKLYTSMMSF